ncbi:hypothetical protein HAX54_028255 [Datura stramonium]|uniref:Transmembrane protein n=1 Tax=Datura stramonium TaxID=4076 RepID=A0ABS8V3U1_DATST|nr:hypothetical protein [Datura stramonium]
MIVLLVWFALDALYDCVVGLVCFGWRCMIVVVGLVWFGLIWTALYDRRCWFGLLWTALYDRRCWFGVVGLVDFDGRCWFGLILIRVFCSYRCFVLLEFGVRFGTCVEVKQGIGNLGLLCFGNRRASHRHDALMTPCVLVTCLVTAELLCGYGGSRLEPAPTLL